MFIFIIFSLCLLFIYSSSLSLLSPSAPTGGPGYGPPTKTGYVGAPPPPGYGGAPPQTGYGGAPPQAGYGVAQHQQATVIMQPGPQSHMVVEGKPPNYFVLSLITLLCFCWIFGIVALVVGSQVCYSRQ